MEHVITLWGVYILLYEETYKVTAAAINPYTASGMKAVN
jgi:hypothetical protein